MSLKAKQSVSIALCGGACAALTVFFIVPVSAWVYLLCLCAIAGIPPVLARDRLSRRLFRELEARYPCCSRLAAFLLFLAAVLPTQYAQPACGMLLYVLLWLALFGCDLCTAALLSPPSLPERRRRETDFPEGGFPGLSLSARRILMPVFCAVVFAATVFFFTVRVSSVVCLLCLCAVSACAAVTGDFFSDHFFREFGRRFPRCRSVGYVLFFVVIFILPLYVNPACFYFLYAYWALLLMGCVFYTIALFHPAAFQENRGSA